MILDIVVVVFSVALGGCGCGDSSDSSGSANLLWWMMVMVVVIVCEIVLDTIVVIGCVSLVQRVGGCGHGDGDGQPIG